MKKLNYGDVLNHALKVTSEEVADVFVRYSGHIDNLELVIHPKGWCSGSDGIDFEGCIGSSLKSDDIEIDEHCKLMIAFIDEHTKDTQ